MKAQIVWRIAAVLSTVSLGSWLVPAAKADDILSNLPGNDGLDLSMFGTQAYGAGFTMNETATLTDILIRLRFETEVTPIFRWPLQ